MDCSVDRNLLIVAGPEKELAGQEIDAIRSFVDQGGKVILLLESGNDAGFTPMLKEFGINYRADLIADNVNNLFGSNSLYPVLELNNHEINVPLKNKNMDVVFFKASGMDIEAEPKAGWVQERLLSTKGGGSWSETGESEEVIMDPEEERGPFTMAAIVGKPVVAASIDTGTAGEAGTDDFVQEKKPEWGFIMAAGDASFVANAHLETSGNRIRSPAILKGQTLCFPTLGQSPRIPVP